MSRAIDTFLGLQLLVGLLVAVAVSVALAPPVARRFRLTRGAAYAGALATVAILSVTLFDRSGLAIGFDVGRSLTWWTTQRESVIDVARSEPGWFLNVALFVPAAAVWTVITKRPIRVAALLAAVASRMTQLRDEVEQVFAGLTIGDINEIRNPNGVGLSPFFDLVSVRPDSYQFYGDERPVEVRYPVDFLGAYRCVFVTFSNASPVFDNGSGQECTEDRYATTDG